MPDDRGGEPAGRRAGRHAGPPAAEVPGSPVPLGRHRRRAAGAGAKAGTAAAVIMLPAARAARPADRTGPGRRREAEHV
ncbi:MAG TPA: hypothetical protein VGM79_12630 [Streptosporangiaceae bacterium]